ncbi:MAG: hypothetical protein MR332_01905 [Fusicatenibacter sp.]|nr:hypothetical protein [Fusicatenibacter sp.]
MNEKTKKRVILFVLLLITVWCGAGTVWAMKENTVIVNARTGSYYGQERQAFANSYINDFSFALTYGFHENYRNGGHVPITVEVSNNGYNEFNGYLVLQTTVNTSNLYGYMDQSSIFSNLFPAVKGSGSARNSVFIYRLPIRIQGNETVSRTFVTGLDFSNYNNCVITMENLSHETIYQESKILAPSDLMGNYVYVGILEKESFCSSVLDGQMLGKSDYELRAISMIPEEITESMLEAGIPDIIVLLDYDFDELSMEQQQRLVRWKNQGGVLISFEGNQLFAENQKMMFEENPILYLEQMIDQDLLSCLMNNREQYFQKYFFMTDLLENMEVRKVPPVLFYGILLGIYIVLTGPGLYLILKRLGKRDYLWLGICVCSLVFVVIIGLLGNQTRMKAPVITYLEEIRQYEDYTEDEIDFGIQAPYNSSYCLYTDPKYQITPYNWSGMSSSYSVMEDQNFDSYEQILMELNDEKTEITLSNMSAFALNFFHLQKKETEAEKEGIVTELHFFDGRVDGRVENQTGYQLENCILIMPGYYIELGNLSDGEQVILNQEQALETKGIESWMHDEKRTETEINYLTNLYYASTVNRRDECLLVGKISGKEMDFQMNSGYEACGTSFYLAEVEVDMEENGVLYCPYAQQYYLWDETSMDFQAEADSMDLYNHQTEVTYNLNCVFEKYNIWKEYLDYIRNDLSVENENILLTTDFMYHVFNDYDETIRQNTSGINEKPRGEILSLEFLKSEKEDMYRESFDGTIEIYNYWTGDYEVLDEWKMDFSSDDIFSVKYLNQNQIRIRYTLPDTDEEQEGSQTSTGYYSVPTLVVKAREYPTEQYLQSVFQDGVELYAEN